jgi:hypothetical protein
MTTETQGDLLHGNMEHKVMNHCLQTFRINLFSNPTTLRHCLGEPSQISVAAV